MINKRLLYQSVKVVVATVFAILLAELLQLHYSTTAGVIAMLSVLDTRKQSLIVGLKRLVAASAAVVLAILLFNEFGHELWVLGVFLAIFVPLLTYMRSTEALAVGTVLVTHVYTINTTEPQVFINELALLFIGVIIGWLLNLHMLNIEMEIRTLQLETEAAVKGILRKMSLQLINQCSLEQQEDTLASLDKLISDGMAKSVHYNDNYILKDYSYYQRYFEMRRQQYDVLKHMQTHFSVMFIAVEEAMILSDYTRKLADELKESNDAMTLMAEWHGMREDYRERPLPVSREAFENRATLFQFMNDLAYFIKIKMAFIAVYGEIEYCVKPDQRGNR